MCMKFQEQGFIKRIKTGSISEQEVPQTTSEKSTAEILELMILLGVIHDVISCDLNWIFRIWKANLSKWNDYKME